MRLLCCVSTNHSNKQFGTKHSSKQFSTKHGSKCFVLRFVLAYYFKTLNNRPWELITSPWVVLVVLVLVFVVPGVVLVVVDVVASHYVYYHKKHPRDYKNQYQDHQDHPGDSLSAPQGRLLAILKYPQKTNTKVYKS